MRKVSIIGKSRYIGAILIVMQGILISLLTILLMDSSYNKQWNSYLEKENSLNVYIKNVSEKYKNNVERFLYNEAEQKNLFIVRKDESSNSKGIFSGYTFGVCGDVKEKDVSFKFLNETIIDKDNLNKLISSKTNESTLGIDKGSIYSIGEIPSFRFGSNTIFKKLNQLIEESGTINGDYIVLGLNNNNKESFLKELASECNVSPEKLTKKMQGSYIDDSFQKLIVCVFIVFQVILNIVYFLIITIQNINKSGKLSLLGWSRTAYCRETLGGFIGYSIINIPIQIVIGILLSGWSKINGLFISYFSLVAIINIVLVLIELSIPTMIQMSITPINAIRGRIPKNILYAFGIIAYIGVSIGIMCCGVYVDAPLKHVANNVKLSKAWNSVSNFQVLKSVSVGNDNSSITGNSKELDESFYNWYKDIYENDGVFLINTTYYNNNQLHLWEENKLYKDIPKKPFWYFACSENYIKYINLNIDKDVLNAAKSGTRVYLIPNSYTEDEKVSLKNWLKESTTRRPSEGDISTTFNKEKNIKFIEYNPNDKLFTWNIDPACENRINNPVIYICTPENMTFFESESLRATGFNGYIKFKNRSIAEKYLNKNILEKFKLNDNNVEFTSVQNYIDGLQKELMTTIAWFGMAFLILIFILVGILISLATVFRIANQEKINVKKFLGYGFIDLYLIPIIMLSSVTCIELIIMLAIGSKLGFVVMLILAVIQMVIFLKYMSRCEIKNILIAFKGE